MDAQRSTESDEVRFTFDLAGAVHHRRGSNQLVSGDTASLSARREPRNEYDKNAVAIRVNGYKAGYVPAYLSEDVAALMDSGYTVRFTGITTSEYYKKKRKKINLGGGEYFYEYEDDYDHPVTTATISIVCKKPLRPLRKAMTSGGAAKDLRGSKPVIPSDGTCYITVADFIVRSHAYSCSHKGHDMTPVEASVVVLVANSFLSERKFRAFYCEQCGMYFVTDTAFERLTRSGRLCCRVIAIDEVIKPKRDNGRFSEYATESIIHQYGYNVSKSENLSSASRQAILSFIIENDILRQYEIISFLEGLVRTRSGMRNMRDAIAKWREDVSFLEQYRPPARSLKVGKLYAHRSAL